MRSSRSHWTFFGRRKHPFSRSVYLSFLCFVGFVVESSMFTIPTDTIENPAQSTPEETEHLLSRPPKTITSFSINTMESLALVEKHIQDEDHDAAEKKIEELWENNTELSLSEEAEVEYMSSRIAHARQNVEATIGFLESVLKYRDNISYTREEEVLLRLSELHLSKKQHAKAHSYLDEWLEIVQRPKAGELAFAGSLFVKIKSFDRAKKYLSRAIELQRENGVDVDTRWSELLDYVEKRLEATQ